MDVTFPGLGLEFRVSSDAFVIGGFAVKMYAVCIALGFALAFVFTLRRAKLYNVSENSFIDVILFSTVAAIIGARAYYVIPKFSEYYKDNPAEIFNIRGGGLAIYGAIIGGAIAAYIVCRIKKLDMRGIFDLGTCGLLIGQAIGRWGNFFNQEAFGTNTTLPWGMFSDGTKAYLVEAQSSLSANGITVDPNLPVHPCFLYESLWCALGFFILAYRMKRRRFDGEITLWYCVWYGLGRFLVEGLRTDSLMTAGGTLRLSQVVSVLIAITAFAVFLLAIRFPDKVYLTVPDIIVPDALEDDTGEALDGSKTDNGVNTEVNGNIPYTEINNKPNDVEIENTEDEN